ncbi:hypothetical protein JZK55_02360 [Dissulfurispira thermophila]|uniref:Uncharacterized protein n=1 Tax=Dissulfurispira thermophila TaxID=2715679 RepID=A0A7G1GY85_9BACT|nr:hypothetical protein [Dissulfurispira thermophila]BCB95314.1 hypothetical protein JZK55_02360 [Dissulfurispira thermophila]
MCPNFNNGICEVVGIEPEEIGCIEICACYRNNMWKNCKVYMLQFFIYGDKNLAAA